MIDATADRFIICGFGRAGRQVARDLRAAAAGGVVIDKPQPPSENVLEPGDVIMAMGTPRTMDRLEHLLAPDHAGAPK